MLASRRDSITGTRISSARPLFGVILRAPENGGTSGTRERARRVLIVEDDYFIAWQHRTALEEMGHEVVGVVGSFADALSLAERERPDLVVMDIRLSGPLDGIDAAGEIEARFGIRSLFVSAYADHATRSRAERARPLGWLSKPFTVEQFMASVRAALERLKGPEN